MKRFAVLVLAFLMLSCTAHEYPYTVYSRPGANVSDAKIAVLPFSSTTREVEFLASDLVSQNLIKNGFRIVDRSYLQNILQEQEVSLTGLTKDTSLQKIGKLVEADYLLVGTVRVETKVESSGVAFKKLSFSGVEQKEFISGMSIRVLSVETGEVVIGSPYALERTRNGEPDTNHARPLSAIGQGLVNYILGKPMPKLILHKDPEQKSP